MDLYIIDKTESVINKYLAEMRDVTIQKDRMRFRRNIERIGELMAYEVSKTLAYAPSTVATPLGNAIVNMPSDQIVVGTILRAGLPMHTGVLNVFDDAENCFASAYRAYNDNHEVEIHLGYAATPDLDGKVLILADPMLATGFSMLQVINQLMRYGRPSHVHILSIIGARPGVEYLRNNLNGIDASLWVATVDPLLNADSYIVPGLGDAGDLAFGEKN
ncbi:MAG: uracil phosphoribosyltransferase [Marinilabiliaceae bacterium]